MDDDGVSGLDVCHRGANLLHPSGVLVSEDVGQLQAGAILDRLPITVADVDVGSAEAGSPYLDQDVMGTFDPCFIDLVDSESLVVVVQPRSLHTVASSGSGSP
jgi:hypothetical protein